MECTSFGEQVELEKYSIYFVYSASDSGKAGRTTITGIVVTDLDGLWTFIPEEGDFCSI